MFDGAVVADTADHQVGIKLRIGRPVVLVSGKIVLRVIRPPPQDQDIALVDEVPAHTVWNQSVRTYPYLVLRVGRGDVGHIEGERGLSRRPVIVHGRDRDRVGSFCIGCDGASNADLPLFTGRVPLNVDGGIGILSVEIAALYDVEGHGRQYWDGVQIGADSDIRWPVQDGNGRLCVSLIALVVCDGHSHEEGTVVVPGVLVDAVLLGRG